jgi:hypothetical protein
MESSTSELGLILCHSVDQDMQMMCVNQLVTIHFIGKLFILIYRKTKHGIGTDCLLKCRLSCKQNGRQEKQTVKTNHSQQLSERCTMCIQCTFA